MQVAEILRSKGFDVATVQPNHTVADALNTMSEHNIGAVVVTSDGTAIDGIVSERDIVRALTGTPEHLLSQEVTTIMTRTVFTCTPTDRLHDLMSRMTDKRIRHLPVEIDGALGGIISIGDVVKHRVSELETEARAMEDYIQGR